MIEDLVSILLPVYNQKNTIKESIDSIVNQTYPYWELIILNDGSTDGVEKVITTYKDPRIKYIPLMHQGLPATLNYGLDIAEGEFITWTSADNIMLPSMLSELVSALKSHPEASAAYTGYYHIDERGRITGQNLKGEYCYDPYQFIGAPNREFLITQYCNFGAAFIYRASACHEAGKFDPQCEGIEDVDYSIRIARTGKAIWVNKILYKYRIHPSSMSGRERNKEISYEAGRKHFWEKLSRDYRYQARN